MRDGAEGVSTVWTVLKPVYRRLEGVSEFTDLQVDGRAHLKEFFEGEPRGIRTREDRRDEQVLYELWGIEVLVHREGQS